MKTGHAAALQSWPLRGEEESTMSATYVVLPDRIAVTIRGRLNYESWRVMRDARICALERQLPLSLDISHCNGGDMGGLGALMIAQHQLGKVSICGCDSDFASWFDKIGVCQRCDHYADGDGEGHCTGRPEAVMVA
jgi:hypothetical protein